MRNTTLIGRVAAVAAVVIAIVAIAVILLSGGKSYQVHAIFQNASQLVPGDQVEVSGNSIGQVSSIALTPNGLADLTLSISNSNYHPLRQGTTATVRQASLSGIANRYIDLRLGSGTASTIPNNGQIGTENTTSAVDLDQLFDTLNPPTLRGLQQFIQGSGSQWQARGSQVQAAWQYLNPSIASTSVLFREINRDTGKFTSFIQKTGGLLTDIAQRRADLAGLVQNLSRTTQAVASQRVALGQALQKFPPFMRLANTTFVNLRSALDDVTPLVNVSKPVLPKVQLLLEQLRPFAQEAVPTVRDLANIVSRPGPNNDLIELTALGPPLAAVTVHNVYASGKLRPGAFPISVQALKGSTPELAFARPYAVDVTGWFEGYSHPGGEDANGGVSRVAPVVGLGSFSTGVLNLLPALLPPPLGTFLPNSLARLNFAKSVLTVEQGDRCPGSMERGQKNGTSAAYYPYSGYPCNPNQIPTGP